MSSAKYLDGAIGIEDRSIYELLKRELIYLSNEKKKVAIARVEDLTEADREYYRATWGFDPVTDRIVPPPNINEERKKGVLPPILYYYEALIPLENDPELQVAGVTLRVCVQVEEGEEPLNFFEFKRDDFSSPVYCVHTVVHIAPVQEVLDLQDEKIREIINSRAGQSAILPPWEHFVALKSYVAGIASEGFLQFFRIAHLPSELGQIPPGHNINLPMPFQTFGALCDIAQDVLYPLILEIFGNLLDQVPAKWIIDRWELLLESGVLEALADKDFLDSLSLSSRKKALEVYLGIYAQARYFDKHDKEILPSLLTEELLNKLDPLFLHKTMGAILHIASKSDAHAKVFARFLHTQKTNPTTHQGIPPEELHDDP